MTSLTNIQVLEIKELISNGVKNRAIGIQYGVSGGVIGAIKRGKTWKYVTSADSIREKWNRARGEKSSTAKLKEAEVWMVRHLLHHGLSGPMISKMFRVSVTSVNFIRRSVTWKDVVYP